MARRTAYTVLLLASVPWIAICISGCEFSSRYVVRGKVKSAIDGTPLSRVAVTVKWSPSDMLPKDPYAGDRTLSPTVSASDGSCSLEFDVTDYSLSIWPKWLLILKKDGCSDEAVDISPDEPPEHVAEKHLIAVAAYMRMQP